MRGCLVQVSPLDPATQTRVVLRAGASLNSRTLKADGQTWYSAISRSARIALDFFDVDYKGTVQFGKATVTLNAKRFTGFARDYLNTLIWVGAPISIWSGDGQATADLNVEFTGLVTAGVIDRTSGLLPLQCEVEKQLLDVPLLNIEYTGGGGANGDPEVKGQLKPACFGNPVNVEPVWFDQVNWVGQIDGYGNVTAINNLYEDAASFGPKQADYASYAALVAAAIPEGAWATCVAQGMIRLGADPRGVITCDPVAGGATPGTMMLRWLQNHAGISAGKINSTSFTDLDAALAALLGHAAAVSYYANSQVSVLDRVQAMCASCNASPFIGPDGKVTVSRAINAGAAAITLNRQGGKPLVTDWRSLDTPDPWWRLKAQAARTWRVHGLNEIDYEDDLVDRGDYDDAEEYRQGHIVRWTDGARYVYINVAPSTGNDPPNPVYWDLYEDAPDASTLTYVDGTPIEALKPAESGANITGTHTAAAITGQGALATLNTADWATRVSGTGKPADNAGTTFDLIETGAVGTLKIVGNSIEQTSGAAGAFSGAYSRDSFKDGAFVSGRIVNGSTYAYLGLGASPINAQAYNGLQYFWRRDPDGSANAISSFVGPVATIAVAGINDVFAVLYDGIKIYWVRNGVVEVTVNVASALRLYVLAVTFAVGAKVVDIKGGYFTQTPDLNRNVYDTGSATPYVTVPRNETRTPLGTAAAIAGQGALATLNSANLDTQVTDGSTYGRILLNQLTSGAHRLTIAGSGMLVGDARNLVPITAANLGFKFTGAVTYTSAAGTPATGTITSAAGNLLLGSQTIAYNAMSANVTGTNSTSTTFYLYVAANVYTPGAHTLLATTSANTVYGGDLNGYLGVVTVVFPASGGGSGGGSGGSGPCVCADTWVEIQALRRIVRTYFESGGRLFIKARDVVAGDALRVLTHDLTATEFAAVLSNTLQVEEAVRLTGKSTGLSLTTSVGTPLTIQGGSSLLPAFYDGELLPTFVEDLAWESTVCSKSGMREVCYISMGGRTYFAGDEPGRMIGTHNQSKP